MTKWAQRQRVKKEKLIRKHFTKMLHRFVNSVQLVIHYFNKMVQRLGAWTDLVCSVIQFVKSKGTSNALSCLSKITSMRYYYYVRWQTLRCFFIKAERNALKTEFMDKTYQPIFEGWFKPVSGRVMFIITLILEFVTNIDESLKRLVNHSYGRSTRIDRCSSSEI